VRDARDAAGPGAVRRAMMAEPTSDPYPDGGPPGKIVLYGLPTSRVCKVRHQVSAVRGHTKR
jgi:hypothetical protein